jgi:hypothetical protein
MIIYTDLYIFCSCINVLILILKIHWTCSYNIACVNADGPRIYERLYRIFITSSLLSGLLPKMIHPQNEFFEMHSESMQL